MAALVVPSDKYATVAGALAADEPVIFVKEGTYSEDWYANSTVYIAPVPGHKVVFTGTLTFNGNYNYIQDIIFRPSTIALCIDVDGGGDNSLITGCTFDVAGAGDAIDSAGTVFKVRRCKFTGGGDCGVTIDTGPLESCIFENVGKTSGSFVLASVQGASGYATNNTFVDCKSDQYVLSANYAYGNILDTPTCAAYAIYALSGHTHNCVYNTQGGGVAFWGGPGTGEITTNPLFVNREAGNYYLSKDSPCVAAGGGNGVLTIQDHSGFMYKSATGEDSMGALEYFPDKKSLIFSPRSGELTGLTVPSGWVNTYYDDFEGGFGNWSNVGGDVFDWTRKSGSTPSGGTGPTSAFEGSWYIYVEASYPRVDGDIAYLEGPTLDLSAATDAQVTFQYHMYNSSAPGANTGTLDLEVSINGGSSWTSVWSRLGHQANAWLAGTAPLAAYAGQASVKLRWVGQVDSYRSDWALDAIAIQVNSTYSPEFPASSYGPVIESPGKLADYLQAGMYKFSGTSGAVGTTDGHFMYDQDGHFRWKSKTVRTVSFSFSSGTSLGYVFPGVSYTNVQDTG